VLSNYQPNPRDAKGKGSFVLLFCLMFFGTGVLLLAKTKSAAQIIKEKFASRQVKKIYLAVTKNCPQIREGKLTCPMPMPLH
jgi:hypothetical protein